MSGTSRPAWGCLDAAEMRDAAVGRAEDPAIREHLATCRQCRHAVRDLQGDLRRPMRTGAGSYRRSLLARPGFWLLLLVLGAIGVGVMVLLPRKAPPPEQTTTSAPEPVVAPAKRPTVRRARARKAGGSPGDAAIVAVIRSNQTGVRLCYERALKRDPRLSVRLDLRVNISSAGVVDRVSLEGLPDGAPLANCIRNVIKTWQFPRAPAAYDTAFPLHLQQGV